ncbi:hypothetical protein GCM10009087_40640 [Sphingomonas oligophenolica]|uniref:Uncharacterized protein n=1 Tax=Sphingomonas oligophenolica TaxID=301154 RepID=A0ABU9Y204_9SPHN
MQLKLQRSQKTGGIVTTNVIFCLDARVEFTPPEARDISRYKLQNQIIYTSEGARSAAEGSRAAAANAKARGIALGNVDDFLTSATGKLGHGLKAAALGAISAMRLTITINSLQRGQHIECKSLDELLGAEDAIMTACENLKGYLATAATFDGREVLVDFNSDQPTIVAQRTTPQPMLVAPAPAGPPVPELTSNYSQPEWKPAPEPAAPEYVARGETFGLPFDWNDPDTRRTILIGGGIVGAFLLLLLLRIV